MGLTGDTAATEHLWHGLIAGSCSHKVAAKGVFSSLAEVKVQEGESIESALRRFKRKVQQEDIIKDIKKHSFYLKPGDRRRAKQALARKRTRKKQRREVGVAASDRAARPAPVMTMTGRFRVSAAAWDGRASW